MFSPRLRLAVRLPLSACLALAALLLVAVTGPVIAPGALAQGIDAELATEAGPENTLGSRSDAEIWRALRHGAAGLPTTLRDEDGVLINAEGNWWSLQRREDGPLIRYGGLALLAVTAVLLLYFAVRGRMRISGGRSGRRIARFTLAHRVVHWSLAFLFVLMALTGFTLLFGRPLLVPIIGKEAFGVVATASMQAHNLFGPIFVVSLLSLFVAFVRGNLPALRDVLWIVRAGGLLGGHASAGRYNAGEKAWFWIAVAGGLVLSATGLVLSFPDALASRNQLHVSELAHAVAAIVVTAFAIGHAYLGTIGTEGALEGMVEGSVDENWARTHHDLWLAEIEAGEGAGRP